MNTAISARPHRLPPGAVPVVPEAEVEAALDRLAAAIDASLAGTRPVVFTVMQGGLVFAGQLLPRLTLELECDYIHVRRYGERTTGGRLQWIAGPHVEVAGRDVLVLDDILDEGVTLDELRQDLARRGAASVRIAVFCRKRHDRPVAIAADFVGVDVPDLFVFGFGMDVAGSYRNLPAVYALPAGSGG